MAKWVQMTNFNIKIWVAPNYLWCCQKIYYMQYEVSCVNKNIYSKNITYLFLANDLGP